MSLGYVINPLTRHSAEHGEDALALARDHPSGRTVVIAGEVPILADAGGVATSLLRLAALGRVPDLLEQVLLGTLGNEPVLGTLVEAEHAALFADDPAYRVLDLRSIAVQGVVPADELGILAQAKALLHWHSRHRFCAQCGAPSHLSAAGYRRDCKACGTQHFPRTDPVAIMLVTRGEQCLLGRQPRFPPGVYSCLAGFVEPGETIEDAVRRETLEEAGIRVGPVRYLASQPWPFPGSLMIGCIAQALSHDIVVDRDELEDARWFTRAEAVHMLAGTHPDGYVTPPPIAIAHTLLKDWVEGA